jgi:hypothetical protein
MYVLQKKATKKYASGRYDLVEDLQQARTYKRRGDALNARHSYGSYSAKEDWEVLPVVLAIAPPAPVKGIKEISEPAPEDDMPELLYVAPPQLGLAAD